MLLIIQAVSGLAVIGDSAGPMTRVGELHPVSMTSVPSALVDETQAIDGSRPRLVSSRVLIDCIIIRCVRAIEVHCCTCQCGTTNSEIVFDPCLNSGAASRGVYSPPSRTHPRFAQIGELVTASAGCNLGHERIRLPRQFFESTAHNGIIPTLPRLYPRSNLQHASRPIVSPSLPAPTAARTVKSHPAGFGCGPRRSNAW